MLYVWGELKAHSQFLLSSDDIKTCQAAGKTILLSIGGATYSEGGFTSTTAATAGAQLIWETFGPDSNSSALRPFGDAVVDGFDFDFEATVSNMATFGNELRSLMDADTSKVRLNNLKESHKLSNPF